VVLLVLLVHLRDELDEQPREGFVVVGCGVFGKGGADGGELADLVGFEELEEEDDGAEALVYLCSAGHLNIIVKMVKAASLCSRVKESINFDGPHLHIILIVHSCFK
jgi:hypothetical protein